MIPITTVFFLRSRCRYSDTAGLLGPWKVVKCPSAGSLMCCEPLDASWFRVLRRMAVRFRLCFGLQRRAVTCTKSYTKGSWPHSGRVTKSILLHLSTVCTTSTPRQVQNNILVTFTGGTIAGAPSADYDSRSQGKPRSFEE